MFQVALIVVVASLGLGAVVTAAAISAEHYEKVSVLRESTSGPVAMADVGGAYAVPGSSTAVVDTSGSRNLAPMSSFGAPSPSATALVASIARSTDDSGTDDPDPSYENDSSSAPFHYANDGEVDLLGIPFNLQTWWLPIRHHPGKNSTREPLASGVNSKVEQSKELVDTSIDPRVSPRVPKTVTANASNVEIPIAPITIPHRNGVPSVPRDTRAPMQTASRPVSEQPARIFVQERPVQHFVLKMRRNTRSR